MATVTATIDAARALTAEINTSRAITATLDTSRAVTGVFDQPGDIRLALVLGFDPLQYCRLHDASTTILDSSGNVLNGSITATDYTAMVRKRTGPYLGLVPQFDPLNVSWVDLLSAGLSAAVNMREMSFFVAIKVNDVGIWTDGISRTLMVLRSVDTQNQVTVQRPTTNNRLSIRRQAGNVLKTHEVTTSSVDWIVIGFDVSESNGVQQLYVNGVATGANQIPNAWTGGALTMARLSPTITTVWYGGMAEWILFDRPIGAYAHNILATTYFTAVTVDPDPGEIDTFTETFEEVF